MARDDAAGQHTDVVIAEPVVSLLGAYGRASPWPAMVTGKLLAWGRRL